MSQTNTTQQTKEQLATEKRELIAQLDTRNNQDATLQLIRENEAKTKELNKVELLNTVNIKYSRLREKALLAWECEQPSEDITTNDGSFHKAKVKKYPKIAALPYASAKWEDNRLSEIRINGEKFYMFVSKYEYSKPTEYTRPETFAEFLQLNSIPANDFTIDQYNAISDKLNALNAELKESVDKYQNGLKSLNSHALSYWGLIAQQNINVYEYLPTVR